MKSQAYLEFLVTLDDDKLRGNLLKSIDTSCSCEEVLKAKVRLANLFSYLLHLNCT